MSKKVVVIGAGFAGLSAATYLAKQGFEVAVFEKLEKAGGRAQVFEKDGFRFDMGPSWYWMPDVFENYFNDFDCKVDQLYDLIKLEISYRVFFNYNDSIDISSEWSEIENVFESIETGSSKKLNTFINAAQQKYEIAIEGFIEKSGLSLLEFVNMKSLTGAFHLDLFKSVKKLVASHFQHPKLRSILEFPVLFLGAMPQNIPALYTLMNYADLKLGTWYPMGGMSVIADSMVEVAKMQGVKFQYKAVVQEIVVKNNKAVGVVVDQKMHSADVIIGAADYHHVEQYLLPENFRNYTKSYWDSRVMAPSALLFYIAIKKKLNSLEHHNLFFDEDFEVHGREIYDSPKWPSRPQMYVSVASKTDPTIAPKGCEALVGLIPVAVGLIDTPEIREMYLNKLIKKIERLTGEDIESDIVFVKNYAQNDFVIDYNAFKGNAYGLANTLKQTAILKPKIKNAKLHNLFYTGQLTVPGPGVPPALISGKIVAKEIVKIFL
ncbi:MAG: phytoene desaturase family protein [Cyclobacteriaceae bacterium]|nr:phytoene desaturase family protein [Cyclobacteriaceae bacterium]